MSEETPIKVDDSASVSDRFFTAISLVDSAPQNAIVHLEQLQKDVTALALFSSNESIEDISTKSLPLIALEFHLAMAHLQAPTTTAVTKSVERKSHVTQSITLFSSFLQRLEQLELLSKEHTKEYHELMMNLNVVDDENAVTTVLRTAGQQREQKIVRFRAKQQAQKEVERLKSLQQRRRRLETDQEEEMDGYDEEALQRQVALTTLSLNETEALDEWYQALKELPLIQMACQMEEQRNQEDRYSGIVTDRQAQASHGLSGKPLQLTHITQNVATGQLQIRKEEVRSQVFRPGWNQPTMTLQEFGEMELKQAMEREAQQKISNEENKLKPRRYDQLVKDGLEDNVDLVDASAELDRQWDNFKDENPRGSGNKMGDRGDRNF
jgi:hypothetical protein